MQVQRGDVQALALTDESFDAVHADRVLQHVSDPDGGGGAGVLKSGGRAVFAEPDWRTFVIDHPDARLPEAYTRYITEHQVRNASVGSQLARLCRSAGLELDAVTPVTTVFDDPGVR